MATVIKKKIVGYEVAKPAEAGTAQAGPASQVPAAPVLAKRDDVLPGATYKIKPQTQEHALYITINDKVDADGRTVPFEIFINSKNMEQFQWIVCVTRLISAVFRKGGDVTFLIEELKSVFDPKGGYYLKGKFYPSVVAHIGAVVEQHLIKSGVLKSQLDDAQASLVAEKRARYEAKNQGADGERSAFPVGATLCQKCNEKSVVKLDGCMTCLNCADSKCG